MEFRIFFVSLQQKSYYFIINLNNKDYETYENKLDEEKPSVRTDGCHDVAKCFGFERL